MKVSYFVTFIHICRYCLHHVHLLGMFILWFHEGEALNKHYYNYNFIGLNVEIINLIVETLLF